MLPVRVGFTRGRRPAARGRGWCRRVAALALAGLLGRSPAAELDAEVSAGNLRILSRTGSTFTVAPDLRDTAGWWFHFHFRVRAGAGETATVVFPGPNPLGVRGPAVSLDGGRTWRWAGADRVRKVSAEGAGAWAFDVAVPAGSAETRWAFAPTYLESHWRAWLEGKTGRAGLAVGELCRSRQGRRVEVIRAGCLEPGRVRGVVLLTARHHACESIASYALEGLLEAVLAEDDLGRRWRSQWQIVAMPFADKDGVEQGDQGKNRRPHDHNRDYNASPLYPEVAAWMKLGAELAPQVRFSLDLHCPHIRGKWNDRVYLVGSAGASWPEKERAFVRTLARVRRGPVPVTEADSYLPAGTAWNTAGNYAAGRSNAAWARDTFPSARLAATLEITYADAFGVEMNPDAARALGRDLAEAILGHLGDERLNAL